MDVEERFNKWKQKYGLALGNNATQLLLIIAGDAIATLKAEQREHEALIKRIEAHAPEQGGEMREALEALAGIRRMAESIERGESWEGGSPDIGTCRILRDIKLISDKARALLARESSEPILEEHDRWIDTDAIPPKPAEERTCGACVWCGTESCSDWHYIGIASAKTCKDYKRKPADERGPEVDALLWMTERLMGLSAALTMREWLAEYRATGKLVVRDADGTVKESLTVAAKERQ